MAKWLNKLERIALRISAAQRRLPSPPSTQNLLLPPPAVDEERGHPFEERNVHPALPDIVKRLFDDGHFSQATFEAFKYIDKVVQMHSGLTDIGKTLMMLALKETSPLIKLTSMQTESERNEQEGYKYLFAGGVIAIRNPRAHEHSIADSPEMCLDHLGLASMLLRRLEQAGLQAQLPTANSTLSGSSRFPRSLKLPEGTPGLMQSPPLLDKPAEPQ